MAAPDDIPGRNELLLQRFLDDDLTDDERSHVLGSLLANDHDRRAVVEQLSIRHTLRQDVGSAPAAIRASVLAAIAPSPKARPTQRRNRPLFVALVGAMMLLAIILHTPEIRLVAPMAADGLQTNPLEPGLPRSGRILLPSSLPSPRGIASDFGSMEEAAAAETTVPDVLAPMQRPSAELPGVGKAAAEEYSGVFPFPDVTPPWLIAAAKSAATFVVDAAYVPTIALSASPQPRQQPDIVSWGALSEGPQQDATQRDQFSIGMRYRLSDEWSVGAEVGRAAFRNTDEPELRTVDTPFFGPAIVVADPTKPLSGVWVAAVVQREGSVSDVLSWYAKAGLGGMEQGPLGRLGGGGIIHVTQQASLRLGVEGTALGYEASGTMYGTVAVGVAAGVVVDF
ncbi:MAG: hypothetical protein MUC47_03890 [Candidatus Kapabacteria bacterium]|nr:hypothetical protein [Candidatus Kapabacteria bacterium]